MSPHALRYFMWQWQHIFQHLAACNAKRLLDPLDPQLAADAFLVGFLTEGAEGTHPICVSPDNCPFQPEVFAAVPNLMQQFADEDPGSRIRYSAPTPPDLGMSMALERGFQKAVEHTLASLDKKSVFFASCPTLVEGYTILIVVQVDRACFDSHYRLTNGFVERGVRFPVGRSFIETTIQAYLAALVEKLRQPDPGRDIPLIQDYAAINRTAADMLMRGPAFAGQELLGIGDIYEVCNAISCQNYEGEEGSGLLVFVRNDHPCIKIDIKLRTPVPIRDYRALRKLLQMGSGKLRLFTDSLHVYGLGTYEGYDPVCEDLFVVRFIKHFTWELSHHENVLMYCCEGTAELRRPCPTTAPIRETLERVFVGRQINHLVKLAETIAAQWHGAMLVITASASEEAVRLAKQATVVEPFPLMEDLIPLVTSIDGAVLIDLEGTCHAIGVILDGLASDKCSSARGARYNSGVRYAYQQGKTDRVVLVKSEDGMVTVLPEA